MSVGASRILDDDVIKLTLAAACAAGDVYQLPGGAGGIAGGSPLTGNAVGDRVPFRASGQYTLPKNSAVNLLDGGRAYWDHTNQRVDFTRTSGRDFYLGRVVGDAAAGVASCAVNLNLDPDYDLDIGPSSFRSIPVGTLALGGFLAPQRRGGAHKLLLSSTNEAQKVDALTKDGISPASRFVLELGVEVVSLGAGVAPDFNIGLASGTHATDADAIAQHLFLHVDGSSSAIRVQAKDGTHTLASTDTTTTLTAGTRFEVWFDARTPAAVKVYVNAVQVLTSTTIDVSAGAAPWYLLAHLEKTAAADTFEVDIDWLRVRTAEQ